MDRRFFYPGELLQDTDLLQAQKNAMIGLGAVAEMTFGPNAAADGFLPTALSNTAVSGSAFAISLSRGFLTQYEQVDPNAFGTLGTDTSRYIAKVGINLLLTNVGITNAAPSTAGQSINYLISAQLTEVDTNEVVLPYVNASNPSTPWTGMGNSGTAQNIDRLQEVSFTVTAGTPAATGTQTTPAVPSGYVPLYVVTINNGDTAANINQIFQYAGGSGGSAFIDPKNTGVGLRAGRLLNVQVFRTPGTATYTPSVGTRMIIVEVEGGGGAGGGGAATGSGQVSVGAGGCTGAYAKAMLTNYFDEITITVGAGGIPISGGQGGGGGTSAFGSLVVAPGGNGGVTAGPAAPPLLAYNGYASGSTPTGGTIINTLGAIGGFGVALSTTQIAGGVGAAAVYGDSTPGGAGTGYAIGPSEAAVAGEAGAPGIVIVWEYA